MGEKLKIGGSKEGVTSAGFAFLFPFGEITPETSEFLPCVLSFTSRILHDNICLTASSTHWVTEKYLIHDSCIRSSRPRRGARRRLAD
jgi:hypothetical protein